MPIPRHRTCCSSFGQRQAHLLVLPWTLSSWLLQRLFRSSWPAIHLSRRSAPLRSLGTHVASRSASPSGVLHALSVRRLVDCVSNEIRAGSPRLLGRPCFQMSVSGGASCNSEFVCGDDIECVDTALLLRPLVESFAASPDRNSELQECFRMSLSPSVMHSGQFFDWARRILHLASYRTCRHDFPGIDLVSPGN
ncbi:hypothetical protein OH76DRAFT_444155 [Lentinus brumalis]|uniref:Uncharacterized protein n=1 Tax=Lentinus brumalis TaxID=2498619 RepID=A0A371DCW6_9APHY|nr:hypothetical protein OH76DRAFT_444155 [Polyporus brumalis]